MIIDECTFLKFFCIHVISLIDNVIIAYTYYYTCWVRNWLILECYFIVSTIEQYLNFNNIVIVTNTSAFLWYELWSEYRLKPELKTNIFYMAIVKL